MTIYDDLVAASTGKGYDDFNHTQDVLKKAETWLTPVSPSGHWVDVLYMLRDNIAVCEMVITTYAHRLPNIKEVLRPLFDYSREISHGDVNSIMHDSQYVVELHKIAPQPDLASLTPDEKAIFSQILALYFLIADQAKRILEPIIAEHFQIQPLIANYQQFLNWQ